MKQLSFLFRVATAIALVGWAAILVTPAWEHTANIVWKLVIGNLALLYVYLAFVARMPDIERTRGSFFSLEGIIALFKSPKAILAAWVHLLAFDLAVALYIRSDAASQGIAHGWLIPVYLLTMMFGPLGLLAYFALRALMVA